MRRLWRPVGPDLIDLLLKDFELQSAKLYEHGKRILGKWNLQQSFIAEREREITNVIHWDQELGWEETNLISTSWYTSMEAILHKDVQAWVIGGSMWEKTYQAQLSSKTGFDFCSIDHFNFPKFIKEEKVIGQREKVKKKLPCFTTAVQFYKQQLGKISFA